jgi:pimeloyl-ACP methyl ester carboxylesterase
MKTLLSSGIVGLSLSLFACSGDDGEPPEVTTATPAAATTTTPTSEDNGGESATPGAVPEPVSADDDVAPVTPTTPEVLPTPTLAALPELDWRPCGQFDNRNIECAELDVPIDYADADGERLTLALRRILANPLDPHHGALLFNPGGPGGPGIDLALDLFKGGIFNEIAPGYDIIGFDPRGVGESGERGCGIFPEDLYAVASEAPADAITAIETLVSLYRELGEECEHEWGPLFRKLGSNNVVRDMEEIRKALKEPVLNFLGASYGTRLGALYAHEYPETTGRIVLDAPVHPRVNYVELVLGQFHQTVALHEALLERCETGTTDCPTNARQLFDQIVQNATARDLAEVLAEVWKASLANVNGLQNIQAAFAAEIADPGGDWILSFLSGGESDGAAGRVASFSVSCTDDTIEPPTAEQLDSVYAQAYELSPVFWTTVTSAAGCSGWPTTRDPVPLPTAIDARPLLVIGGTQDLRTPYEWAQAMTETLGNATLLTSNHYGHVAIASGSQCAKQVVRAYLTSGSLPASGAICN